MKTLIAGIFLGVLTAGTAAWAMEIRKVDMDGDGFREAEVFYQEGRAVRAILDIDRDGRSDGTVLYKEGRRDRAELDMNRDGMTDTWVSYYFTGVPWKAAEDLNRDGKPDYWSFLKDGVVYRWEQDRNRDGKADIRTIYDLRGERRILLEQSFDDDYDGYFENLSKISAANKEAKMPHSLAEALLR